MTGLIDVHHHILPPDYVTALGGRIGKQGLTGSVPTSDPDLSVADMDRDGLRRASAVEEPPRMRPRDEVASHGQEGTPHVAAGRLQAPVLVPARATRTLCCSPAAARVVDAGAPIANRSCIHAHVRAGVVVQFDAIQANTAGRRARRA